MSVEPQRVRGSVTPPPSSTAAAPSSPSGGDETLPAPLLVDATVDSTPAVRTAVMHVQQMASSSALGAARLCLSLQALQFALDHACAGLHSSRSLAERIRAWLPALIGDAAANRHLKTWKSTKRLYATPADLLFWQQLLSDIQPTMQLEASAESAAVPSSRFTMELLRFLHLEYDAIAVVWPSAAERHTLWRSCCLSERRLHGIVLWVGQRIQQHHAQHGAMDPSVTGFHTTTQGIFEQQLQLLAAHGSAARQRVAAQLAESLQHYGNDSEEMEKEAEEESNQTVPAAVAAAAIAQPDVEMKEEDDSLLVRRSAPCDATSSLHASPSVSPLTPAICALRPTAMDDVVPRRSARLLSPTPPLVASPHSLPSPLPASSKKRAPKTDRCAAAKTSNLHVVQATPHLTPPLPPPSSNQHWRESHLDGFNSLMARYPLLLRRGACLEPSGLHVWQQRPPLLDSMALVVRGIERRLPNELLSDSHAAIHAELATSIVDAPETVMQLDDTVEAAQSFCFAPDQRYFVADLLLATVQQHMTQLATQQSLSLQHRSLSPLDGGVLWHLQQEESTIEMPHGVADWTLSYHLDNCPPAADTEELVAAAATAASAALPFSATRISASPRSARPPYPIYFHCEPHRAGVVNLRLPDVSIHVGRMEATKRAARAVSRPVHWICILPEEQNMRLFHNTMSEVQRNQCGREPVATEEQYCIDQQRQPALSSIEPLLRAGVAMLLLEQQEGDLVVLQPGVPHFVLTPPRACKASRNWMTADSLVHAAVRVIQGQQGERDEWFPALCNQPLRCLLLTLRRMQRADPTAFEQLATHPISGTQLRYALHRALSSAAQTIDPLPADDAAQADDLRLMAQHLVERMSAGSVSSPADEWQRTLSQSTASGADSPTQVVLMSPDRAQVDAPMNVLAAAAASTSSDSEDTHHAAAVPAVEPHDSLMASTTASFLLPCGLEDRDLIRRCRAFRLHLFRRLAHDCPLSSLLVELKRLLLSSTPPATVQEMCADLEQRQSEHAAAHPPSALELQHTTREQLKVIDAAHRQRHMRTAKQEQLVHAAKRERQRLLASYQSHDLKPPDTWEKLADLEDRITQLSASCNPPSPPCTYSPVSDLACVARPHSHNEWTHSLSLCVCLSCDRCCSYPAVHPHPGRGACASQAAATGLVGLPAACLSGINAIDSCSPGSARFPTVACPLVRSGPFGVAARDFSTACGFPIRLPILASSHHVRHARLPSECFARGWQHLRQCADARWMVPRLPLACAAGGASVTARRAQR